MGVLTKMNTKTTGNRETRLVNTAQFIEIEQDKSPTNGKYGRTGSVSN